MNQTIDWKQKLNLAIERITTRYEQIGRKTGAPFLAIVYPPDLEEEVMSEWRTLTSTLHSDYDFREIDLIFLIIAETEKLGVENVVKVIHDPMPGSNAELELGQMWVRAVADAVREESQKSDKDRRIVLVLVGLAALYPVAGPRDIMQTLWDKPGVLDGPVVVFIPGSFSEPRVYSFLNIKEEFMYRGDIL